MIEKCVLAGGCFWCMEAVFQDINGIIKVEPGYSGGTVENPTYEEVCTNKTGHAESVRITYDNSVILYNDILKLFFAMHDPTQLNHQGNDMGTQYRSAIFYLNDDQKEKTNSYIKKLEENHEFNNPIVTAVKEFTNFYPAEDYHKNYYKNNPQNSYCRYIISPKVKKLKKYYSPILKINKSL